MTIAITVHCDFEGCGRWAFANALNEREDAEVPSMYQDHPSTPSPRRTCGIVDGHFQVPDEGWWVEPKTLKQFCADHHDG